MLYFSVKLLKKAWATKSYVDAVGGLLSTVSFLQRTKQLLNVCEGLGETPDWTNFDEIMSIMPEPESWFYADQDDVEEEDVIRSIPDSMWDELNLFNQGKFEAFGTAIGTQWETDLGL